MGALFSALMSLVNPRQEYKLIIVGLDNAGKTTTLYKLHLGEVVMTQPTIGSNVESIKHNNVHFEVWDLGGQTTLRNSWQSYYRNTASVIMMARLRLHTHHPSPIIVSTPQLQPHHQKLVCCFFMKFHLLSLAKIIRASWSDHRVYSAPYTAPRFYRPSGKH